MSLCCKSRFFYSVEFYLFFYTDFIFFFIVDFNYFWSDRSGVFFSCLWSLSYVCFPLISLFLRWETHVNVKRSQLGICPVFWSVLIFVCVCVLLSGHESELGLHAEQPEERHKQ